MDKTHDTTTLRGMIQASGLKKNKISELLGFDRVTFYRRLRNIKKFELGEVIMLAEILKRTPVEVFEALLKISKEDLDENE